MIDSSKDSQGQLAGDTHRVPTPSGGVHLRNLDRQVDAWQTGQDLSKVRAGIAGVIDRDTPIVSKSGLNDLDLGLGTPSVLGGDDIGGLGGYGFGSAADAMGIMGSAERMYMDDCTITDLEMTQRDPFSSFPPG